MKELLMLVVLLLAVRPPTQTVVVKGSAPGHPIANGHFTKVVTAYPALYEVFGKVYPDLRLFTMATDPIDQWGLERIQAEALWDNVETPAKIAVLDTGWDFTHEDQPVITDAWDFYDEDPDPTCESSDHGLHVASLAVMPTNDLGIAGVCPLCSFMPLRVGDYLISAIAVIEALEHAANHGAAVANLSFGGAVSTYDPLDYALSCYSGNLPECEEYHMAIVAAAGNGRGGELHYPASHPDVIAVSATTRYDTLAPFSSTGNVDFAAPGTSIIGACEGGYCYQSGTSMAAPHVAGAWGLIKSIHPAWRNEQIYAWLKKHAHDLGDREKFGWGVINLLSLEWHVFLPYVKGGDNY